MGEPVRRADDEVFEGVPGVQCGPRGRRFCGRCGDRDGAGIGGRRGHGFDDLTGVFDGLVDPRTRIDGQLEADVVARDVLEDGRDQTAVTGANPLADHRVRDRQPKLVAVEIDRTDVAKPRIPGRFGQLRL